VQLKLSQLTRLIRVIKFSISHVLTKCSLPVLYCQYQSTTPDQTGQPDDSGECLKKVNNTNKYVYCLIVYPKTENRKPVGSLSKTENPVLTAVPGFANPKDEVRTKTKTKIDDETKQSLIKQGKEQAVEQFKNMFGKT
jgi:hypothetical protein